MSDIKRAFINAIERTGDPLAPIKLQDAYIHTVQLGKLMAQIGSKDKANQFSKTMLASFPDDMDHIASDPSFICTLCSLLTGALERYRLSLNKPTQS